MGFGIATYLGLYQLQAIPGVWEPFFGDGSRQILRESSIARLLPVPDALLGAGAYLLEAVLGVVGGHRRWQTRPWIVIVQGILAGALAFGGVALAACQPLLFLALCTLCLASSACSILVAGLMIPEVRAAWHFAKRKGEQRRAPQRAFC